MRRYNDAVIITSMDDDTYLFDEGQEQEREVDDIDDEEEEIEGAQKPDDEEEEIEPAPDTDGINDLY